MFHILFKHGEDDYAFWQVEVNNGDMEQLYNKGEISGAPLDELLGSIKEIDSQPNTVNFLFMFGDNRYSLWSVEAGQQFFDKYQNEGYSIRGTMEDVKKTITDIHNELTEQMERFYYGLDIEDDGLEL